MSNEKKKYESFVPDEPEQPETPQRKEDLPSVEPNEPVIVPEEIPVVTPPEKQDPSPPEI